jgi:hypothetical protein
MPTFLLEFEVLTDAADSLSVILNGSRWPRRCLLASPAAQEYFPKTDAARDPDKMLPAPDQPLVLQQWQLAWTGSATVSQRFLPARRLAGAEEEQYWSQQENFSRHVLGRHRNAMLLKSGFQVATLGNLLQTAQAVASHHNFIAAMLAVPAQRTLLTAFVPLSVDPPAVPNYANALRDLKPAFGAASWSLLACPKEVFPYVDDLGVPSLSWFARMKWKFRKSF